MSLPVPRLLGASDGGDQDPAPPAAGPEPAAEQVPQAAAPARAAAAARWFRNAGRQIEAREESWAARALAGHMPSVNDQRDYLANKRWLKPGHEGGYADRLGEAYHVAYGIPGVASGNARAWSWMRPWRSLLGFARILLLVFAAGRIAGKSPATCEHAAIIAAAAMAVWYGLVFGLLEAARAWQRARAGRKASTA